jgi:RimJ/RimL family protein N-acetyltransferase
MKAMVYLAAVAPPALQPRSWFPDELPGERVVLRRHVPENVVAVRRWYADPEVARLTRYQDGPMRAEEIDRFFASRVVGPDALAMAIHVRDTGRLIGTCSFSQLDPDNGSTLFHITIGERDAWGQGFGTEATGLMVAHAFGTLGLHRIALSVFEFNERAIRAYARVGFRVEGRARQAIWRDGRWWDEIQMSVLSEEWTRRGSRPAPSPSPRERDGRATPSTASVTG